MSSPEHSNDIINNAEAELEQVIGVLGQVTFPSSAFPSIACPLHI